MKEKNSEDEWNYDKQICLGERHANNYKYMTSKCKQTGVNKY